MHGTSARSTKLLKGKAKATDGPGHSPNKAGDSTTKQKHKTTVKDVQRIKDEMMPTQDDSEQGDAIEPTQEQVEAEIQRLLDAEMNLPGQPLSQELVVHHQALDEHVTTVSEPRLHFMAQLTHLRMDRLRINDLPKNVIASMPALTHVYLQHNHITCIKSLGLLPKLEFAAISNNRVAQVDGLQGLSQLMFLDLAHNHITDLDVYALPDSIRFLKMEGNPCMAARRSMCPTRKALFQHLQHLRDLDGTMPEEEQDSDTDTNMDITTHGNEHSVPREATAATAHRQGDEDTDENEVGVPLQSSTSPSTSPRASVAGTASAFPMGVTTSGIGSHLLCSNSAYSHMQPASVQGTRAVNREMDVAGDDGTSSSKEVASAIHMLEALERSCVESSMAALSRSMNVHAVRASTASTIRASIRPGSAADMVSQVAAHAAGQGPASDPTSSSRPSSRPNSSTTQARPLSTQGVADQLKSKSSYTDSASLGSAGLLSIGDVALSSRSLISSSSLKQPLGSSGGMVVPGLSMRPSSPLPPVNSLSRIASTSGRPGSSGDEAGMALPSRLSMGVLPGRNSKPVLGRPGSRHGSQQDGDLKQQMLEDLDMLQAKVQRMMEPLAAALADLEASPSTQSTQYMPSKQAQHADNKAHTSRPTSASITQTSSQGQGSTSKQVLRPGSAAGKKTVSTVQAATAQASTNNSNTISAGGQPSVKAGMKVLSRPGSASNSPRPSSASASIVKKRPAVMMTSLAAAAGAAGTTFDKSLACQEQGSLGTASEQHNVSQDVVQNTVSMGGRQDIMPAGHKLVSQGTKTQAGSQALHAELDRMMASAAARVAEQRARDADLSSNIRGLRSSTTLASQLKGAVNLKAAMAAGTGVIGAVRDALQSAHIDDNTITSSVIQGALQRHVLSSTLDGTSNTLNSTNTTREGVRDEALLSAAPAGKLQRSGSRSAGDGTAALRQSFSRLCKLSAEVLQDHGGDPNAIASIVTPSTSQTEDQGTSSQGNASTTGSAGGVPYVASKYYQTVLARVAASGKKQLDDVEEGDGEDDDDDDDIIDGQDISDDVDVDGGSEGDVGDESMQHLQGIQA